MFLIINTAEPEKVTVALSRGDFILSKKIIRAKYKESEKLLPAIDKLLKKNNIKLKDLKGVIIVKGPGGFTSLRVGVVVANTLGYSLQIPVAGVKLDEFKDLDDLARVGQSKLEKLKLGESVEPFYGKEPNITVSQRSLPEQY